MHSTGKQLRLVRGGLVLITVMWAIMLMAVIVAVTARAGRFDTRITAQAGDRIRGRWACSSGVEMAIAMLNDDPRQSDSLGDMWSDSEIELEDILLDGAVCSMKIVDEMGKLNINTASKEQLLNLEYMTEEIAAAIIDWRDQDSSPSTKGAEDAYYRSLTVGYKARNGPFRTVRELLKVRGITDELLYGEDTNLNGQLDYNECDGDDTAPGDNNDDVLDQGWVAYMTCYSYGNNKDGDQQDRVNINTASETDLTSKLEIRRSYAKWIVENRKDDNNNGGGNPNGGEGGDGNNEDGTLECISDLIDKNSPKEASGSDSDEAQKMDLDTFKRVADKMTITDDNQIMGLINVNTASREVLKALFEGDQAMADNVITYRTGLVSGIETVGKLLEVQSMKVETFKKIAKSVTTRSNVFRVTCNVVTSRTGAVHESVAVIDRDREPCEILYLHQGG